MINNIDRYTISNGIIYHKLHLQSTIVRRDNRMINNAIFCAFLGVLTMSTTANGKLTKTKMMKRVWIKFAYKKIEWIMLNAF